MQFAPRQHRFQQVARVHRPVGLARADDGVQLVDEEDDLALRRLHLVQDRFQTLFKLAPELRPRDQRAHIQREQHPVAQVLGYVAFRDTDRQPLRDRGLADAGFADQAGIVLGFPRQDPDHVPDLVVPPDHGIELLALRLFGQIRAVLFQYVVGRLGIVARHLTVAPHLFQRREDRVAGHAVLCEDGGERRVGFVDQREQQMFDRDKLVAHLLRDLLGFREGEIDVARHVDPVVAARFHLGQPPERDIQRPGEQIGFDPRRLEQPGDQPVSLGNQRPHQVDLLHLLVAVLQRQVLRFS